MAWRSDPSWPLMARSSAEVWCRAHTKRRSIISVETLGRGRLHRREACKPELAEEGANNFV